MDEPKETETKEPEAKPVDTGEGDKSELAKETELANAAAERMEKATERQEAAIAKARLGGISEAGQPPVEAKEETDKEYKDRIIGSK